MGEEKKQGDLGKTDVGKQGGEIGKQGGMPGETGRQPTGMPHEPGKKGGVDDLGKEKEPR